MIKKRTPKNVSSLRGSSTNNNNKPSSEVLEQQTAPSSSINSASSSLEITPAAADEQQQSSLLNTSTTTTLENTNSISASPPPPSEEEDNFNQTLEKTILKQKLRSRPKGLQATTDASDFSLEKQQQQQRNSSSEQQRLKKLNILQGGTQGGLVDRTSGDWIAMKLQSMEKAKILAGSGGGSLGGGGGGNAKQLAMDMAFTEAELSEQDKRLFEYIQDRLKEQGKSSASSVGNGDGDDEQLSSLSSSSSTIVNTGGEENSSSASSAASSSSSALGSGTNRKKISVDINELLEKEKNLYKLPEELKVEKIDISNQLKRFSRRDRHVREEVKPLTEEERQKLLSGAILEVPLSTAAKVENIRETNEKVKELEDSNKRKYYQTASDEYVFTQYKKKYAHKR